MSFTPCRAEEADVVAGLAASSSSLRNISTPVTRLRRVAAGPTRSILSFITTLPRSTRPVTTVPRPVIVNTSSTGIRNGLSFRRVPAPGCTRRTPSISAHDRLSVFRVAFRGPSVAEPRMIGGCSPGELILVQQVADFLFDQVQEFRVVDHVDLVQEDDDRNADLVASRMCSRVCGIGPSAPRRPGSRRPSAPRP